MTRWHVRERSGDKPKLRGYLVGVTFRRLFVNHIAIHLPPAAWQHLSAQPPLPARDIAIGVVGGVGFVFYIVWIALLLRRVRPALARWLGQTLGVSIKEDFRGQWAAPRAPWRLGCIVALADIALLLLGTLGPLLLFTVAVLLLSGT